MAATRPVPPKPASGPTIVSRLQDLVVITGYSGAGKSTAMNVFEDAGYFCVDNLPPEMIRSLVELFVHEGSKVERAAVVSDVRGGVYFEALTAVIEDLEALGITHHVLFLEASEQTLVHPLQGDPPSPSFGARGERRRGRSLRGRFARAFALPRGLGDRHDRHVGRDAALAHRRRDAAPPSRRTARAHIHELRLQARSPARGGPRLRRPLSCPTRTTSTTCAS